MTGPALAFLIPTRDRHVSLARSLLTVLPAARAVGATVVVCDQSGRPFPSRPGMRILHRPDLGGLPAARNALLRAVDAPVVCFLDDDTDLAPDFAVVLSRVAAAEPDLLGWGPVVETRPRRRRRLHRLAQLGALRDPRRLTGARIDATTRALFGCCFAVRRDAAVAVGFDERRRGYALGEDLDFFLRLGGPLRFVAALRAIHRRDGANRASPRAATAASTRLLLWLARRHGRHQPATVVHLALALGAAASGRGMAGGDWRGAFDALRDPAWP